MTGYETTFYIYNQGNVHVDHYKADINSLVNIRQICSIDILSVLYL